MEVRHFWSWPPHAKRAVWQATEEREELVYRPGMMRQCSRAARCNVVGRCRVFARGRPYTPVGTVQDFTASPQHPRLAEMQRELDEMNGRPPSRLYEGPTITTAHGARPLFEPDMRDDSAGDGLPEHYVAACQRMMTLQSDSYGESIRGVVSPPPPLDACAPRAYHPPRVELGGTWCAAVALIVLAFFLMAKFGR